MDAQENLPRLPSDVKFRVLIIGRANAGKTSILQRVCDTTESPVSVDSSEPETGEQARRFYRRLLPKAFRAYLRQEFASSSQVALPNSPSSQDQVKPSMERGEHDIENELTFTNNRGYVFHDSRGFEAGDGRELKIVQEFVRRRSLERNLNQRLHAIWYCVPMDNARPSLDLKYVDDICPDKNVPVIAVFTKYDQFRRDIWFKLEDQKLEPALLDTEVERIFKKEYLAKLRESAPFARLEKMHKKGQQCTELVERTANELSSGAVAIMLLAIQKENLELSIKQAVLRAHAAIEQGNWDEEKIITICIMAFPSLWVGCITVFRSGSGSEKTHI